MCLCRLTEMIHIHCSAQFPAPINLNFYEYSWYKLGEMRVYSNKMPPACATTALALKGRWVDMSSYHLFSFISHCSLPPPVSGCSSAWQSCSTSGSCIHCSSALKLFLPDPPMDDPFCQSTLCLNALPQWGLSWLVPLKKALCRFQSLFERKYFIVC